MAQQANQYLNELQQLGINIVAIPTSGTLTGLVAKKGTLAIDPNATGTTQRLWINTDGSSTWASFTSSS